MNAKQQYKRAYSLMRDENDSDGDWVMAMAAYPTKIRSAVWRSHDQRNEPFNALTRKQYRRVLKRLESAGLAHLKPLVYPKAFPKG